MASSFTATKVKEIHSGVIHKVGGRVKTWHKRWLILKSDHTLQYFKDPSKAPLGSISISDPSFCIQRGEEGSYGGWPKNCSLETTLVITTSGRVYYMYTDNVSETEEWIRIVEAERGTISKSTPQSLPGRYNKMGGKASSLEMPSAVESSSSRTPKQYKKKDRRLPTKRFASDSVVDSDDGSGIESDTAADGQLDPSEFTNPSISINDSMTSQTSPPSEPLYDLITQENIQNDKNRPVTTSSTSLLSPQHSEGHRKSNGSSFNSSDDNRNLKDSVSLNESLYDLVGRINAGEDGGGASVPPTINQAAEPQELYEPIADTPLVKGPASPTRGQVHISEQLYDSVNEGGGENMGGDMYEDVDRGPELKEAESSDDDERVPLPPSKIPNPGSPPPPLPPRAGEEMYDNAPTLPPKNTNSSSLGDEDPPDSEEFYGNTTSTTVKMTELSYPVSPSRPPKPLPRSTPSTSSTANDEQLPVTPAAESAEYGEELYDDIAGAMQSSSGSNLVKEEEEGREKETNKTHEEEVVENRTEVVSVEPQTTVELQTTVESQTTTVESQTTTVESQTTTVESQSPTAVQSQSPTTPKSGGGRRIHAATVGSTDAGIEMFYRRAQELSSLGEEEAKGVTKHVKDLFEAKKEAILSSEDKVVLAETLREVETEKQLASEERFKWERERLKLEEERKKFEREKQQLLEELAKAKAAQSEPETST